LAPQASTLAADSLDALSGYLIGYLTYPSYVTRGDFAGLTLASSPQFGLVAGVNSAGAGQVLFVNLPLTYLKGRTDALPLHGFLSYFVRQMGKAPYISPMPGAVAGLTLNWHLDSMDAQAPTLALEQLGLFNPAAPSSMHITAGPDTIGFGDGLGWNLNNNLVAQDLLKRLVAAGQDVGNHGGWIHDYYGGNANETNSLEFLSYLQLNQQAVDGLLGKPSRSYSAPEGNNPKWAMTWLEQQGVVGAYFLGHTGLGATRHFRDGQLLNPKLYVFPVTPNGMYATFEEWQYFNVPKADVIAWYHDLVDFSIQNDTNRLIYMHPPGAYEWVDVVQDLMAYTQSKGAANFRWYTMPALSDALQRRLAVKWTQAVQSDGSTRFDATHPSNLSGTVWKLAKTRYQKPRLVSGNATVADGGSFWMVKVSGSKTLQFVAKPV
ncbi:polysaccharide deacetylase family protein, partial [Ramlibacter sp.]|uniref:polysaccharide deacetylase family protein n=1 Tax=Ramlibacter sp. TaxID=1917967 RepID=UPI0017D986D3